MMRGDNDGLGAGPSQTHKFLSDPEDIHDSTGLSPGGVPAFVFLCKPDTQPHCLANRKFGMIKKHYREMVRRIGADTRLFLLNMFDSQLYGPFAPASRPFVNSSNNSKAFRGLPAQINFAELSENSTKTIGLKTDNPHRIDKSTMLLDESQFAWVMEHLRDCARDPFKAAEEALEAEGMEDGADDGTKKKKRPRFDENVLLGPEGLPKLRKFSDMWKPRGAGHEVEDLRKLMGMYQRWGYDMHKGLSFPDLLQRVDRLMARRSVHHYVTEERERVRLLGEGDRLETEGLTTPAPTGTATGAGERAGAAKEAAGAEALERASDDEDDDQHGAASASTGVGEQQQQQQEEGAGQRADAGEGEVQKGEAAASQEEIDELEAAQMMAQEQEQQEQEDFEHELDDVDW